MARVCFGTIIALGMACLCDSSKTALLIIDVQECFLENGSLPVTASFIIPRLNSIRAQKSCLFDKVFKSQDYHPTGHISFASTHGKALAPGAWQGLVDLTCMDPSSGRTVDASCCPTFFVNASVVDCSQTWCPGSSYYATSPGNNIISNSPACTACAASPGSCFRDVQSMWRDHCLQDGDSTFAKTLTSDPADVVVQKGTNKYVDAYSAFMDNSRVLKTALDSELQAANIDTLYVAGIATDVCVKWTVRDALSSLTGNYTVKVITDASAGIYAGTGTASAADAEKWFVEQGAGVVTTADVLAMGCPQAPQTTTTTRSATHQKPDRNSFLPVPSWAPGHAMQFMVVFLCSLSLVWDVLA